MKQGENEEVKSTHSLTKGLRAHHPSFFSSGHVNDLKTLHSYLI
jgi:hypothetical protein